MRTANLCILGAALCLMTATTCRAQQTSTSTPLWLWHPFETSDIVRFDKSFELDADPISASLLFYGDYTDAEVSLAGQTIIRFDAYDQVQRIEISHLLNREKNELSINVKPVKGPSVFFVILEIEFANGITRTIFSDHSWRSAYDKVTAGVVSYGAIDQRFVVAPENRIDIRAMDDYEQWKRALKSDSDKGLPSHSIREGFELQRIRSATKDEGSWVSMAFDRHGKLIIAKESRGLLRMTLSKSGDMVEKTELINDSLKECRGIVSDGRSLFVNANNSKALYRLTAKADGTFQDPALIYASAGSVGHGRNDLAIGPDNKLYVIHGDAVRLPTEATDHTSPLRAAQRGETTSEGHLLRINPDSGAVEVLAAGLRNPYGIDFNEAGDCFTYDADAEYDMGAPWYRPTRVIHLMTGSDYGWRGVTKSWPPYYPDRPDAGVPNLDIGKGSPTAVKFARGDNFPERFSRALFILDWAYGRIIAVHTIPCGSSYVMTAETFLQGRPLNVTDLDFDRSGAMYFITGGRKTESALYRVKFVGKKRTEQNDGKPYQSKHQSERIPFVKNARSERRALESQFLVPVPNQQQSSFDHKDPWISHAAINLYERSRERSTVSPKAPPLLLLSAARRQSQLRSGKSTLSQLNDPLLEPTRRIDKWALLYAYSLCLKSKEKPSQDEVDHARNRLRKMYPTGDFQLDRLLGEMLVQLGDEDVVGRTIDLLKNSQTQEYRLQCLHVLRNAKAGWTQEMRQAYFQALRDANQFAGGAGMPEFIAKIRDEAVSNLSKQEREKLGDLIQSKPERKLFTERPARKFVRKWTVDSVMALDFQSDSSSGNGKQIFADASCAKCHRVGSFGTLVGPDLSSVSRRFSRRDLVKSIIHPSAVIAPKYRSVKVVMDDGKTFVGRPAMGGDYRSSTLRLSTDPNEPFKIVEIEKRSIQQQEFSNISWMPEGLLDTLTSEEVQTLIRYIERGK